MPLDTRQDSRHIICRTPSVLQNVQAQLSRSIDIGVEHLADKLDRRRLVWILFLKMHYKSKGAVFEWGFRWANDDGVPAQDINTSEESRVHVLI